MGKVAYMYSNNICVEKASINKKKIKITYSPCTAILGQKGTLSEAIGGKNKKACKEKQRNKQAKRKKK